MLHHDAANALEITPRQRPSWTISIMGKGRVHKHIDRLLQRMDSGAFLSCHVVYVCGNKSIIQNHPA